MFHNKTGRRKLHLIYINVSVHFQSNKLFCDRSFQLQRVEWSSKFQVDGTGERTRHLVEVPSSGQQVNMSNGFSTLFHSSTFAGNLNG